MAILVPNAAQHDNLLRLVWLLWWEDLNTVMILPPGAKTYLLPSDWAYVKWTIYT